MKEKEEMGADSGVGVRERDSWNKEACWLKFQQEADGTYEEGDRVECNEKYIPKTGGKFSKLK